MYHQSTGTLAIGNCIVRNNDAYAAGGLFSYFGHVRVRDSVFEDDTAALQKALDDLGTPQHAHILYLPAGTYRITHGLRLAARKEVERTIRELKAAGLDPARMIEVEKSFSVTPGS